jgi:hypothetical protein
VRHYAQEKLVFATVALLFASIILECHAYTLSGIYSLNIESSTQPYQVYASTSTDTSAIYVSTGTNLILINQQLQQAVAVSSLDESNSYGLNDGALTTGGSTITISGGTVTKNGQEPTESSPLPQAPSSL